jgi:uncharacterized delta-60 repeat protein
MVDRRFARRTLGACLVAAALVVTISSGTAAAAGGDLDPSFGSGGFAFASSPGTYSGARAVVIDASGRVVTAGFVHQDSTINQGVMLARFGVDGAADGSFGTGGVVITDLPDRFDEASAIALMPDGRVVVAGRSGDDVLVARYLANGTLDGSFGGGVVLLDLGGEEVALAIAVTDSGKVIVTGRALAPSGGVCCTMDALVARYRSNGTLDPAFGGGDGIVTVDLVPGAGQGGSDRLQSVRLAPGGAIVAAGTNGGDMALVRLRADGTLDRSFGSGGVVTADVNGWPDEGAGVDLLPNGRIIVAGAACREPGSSDEDCDVAVWRYRANGTPDSGFGTNGRVLADLGAAFGEKAVDLVRQSDGKLVVAAQTYGQGGLDLALVRFKPGGGRDNGFGHNGVVTADVAGATDEATGVALQPNGRIVVAGIAGLTTTFSFVAAGFTAA